MIRPLRRGGVNKGRSARRFRGHVGRTHPRNVRGSVMRGGIRL
jgi:hypothetical protein